MGNKIYNVLAVFAVGSFLTISMMLVGIFIPAVWEINKRLDPFFQWCLRPASVKGVPVKISCLMDVEMGMVFILSLVVAFLLVYKILRRWRKLYLILTLPVVIFSGIFWVRTVMGLFGY